MTLWAGLEGPEGEFQAGPGPVALAERAVAQRRRSVAGARPTSADVLSARRCISIWHRLCFFYSFSSSVGVSFLRCLSSDSDGTFGCCRRRQRNASLVWFGRFSFHCGHFGAKFVFGVVSSSGSRRCVDVSDICERTPNLRRLIWVFLVFFLGLTRIHWVLPGWIGFLPGFTWFYLVLLGFIGLYLVLLGFTGFYWVLLGFTGFYWVLPGFTWFYLVLLGFIGFYWVLLGFTGFYWVLLGVEVK